MSVLEPVRVVLDWVDGEFDAYHVPSERWNGFVGAFLTDGSARAVARELEDFSWEFAPVFWFTTDRSGRDALVIWRKGEELEDIPVTGEGLYDFRGWCFVESDLWA